MHLALLFPVKHKLTCSPLSLPSLPPLQRGPSWVLFNLGSLYWRIVGNPRQAIECQRRAIHMCPPVHRDVGYVGLSNTLRRLGRVDDAVKATRAALDVNFDEVCVCACVCACVRACAQLVVSSCECVCFCVAIKMPAKRPCSCSKRLKNLSFFTEV